MATQSKTLPTRTSVPADQVTYQLAAELAAGLYSSQDILDRFSLSAAELASIINTPHFKEIYREAKSIWHGTDNVKERIRLKSAMLLEDSVLPIYSIVHDVNITPSARIDAFAKLVAIADMQPTKQDGGGNLGEKFVLNIKIGDDSQQVVIEADTNDEAAASAD